MVVYIQEGALELEEVRKACCSRGTYLVVYLTMDGYESRISIESALEKLDNRFTVAVVNASKSSMNFQYCEHAATTVSQVTLYGPSGAVMIEGMPVTDGDDALLESLALFTD